MNCFNLACPKCKSGDGIDIAATVYVRLTKDGTGVFETQRGDHEWDDDCAAMCVFGLTGTLAELIETEGNVADASIEMEQS